MRIKWIDIAKGIAIILVIIGHTTDVDSTRGLIFSFHMPLFFMASAFTMKYSDSIKMFFKKNIKSILKMFVIAYGLFICRRILNIVIGNSEFVGIRSFVINSTRAILYSRGVSFTNNGVHYDAIGMVWFLVVFALAKCLYDLLHLLIKNQYIRGIICLCCTLVSLNLSYLPFSFDLVLAVLIFYYCGDMLKSLVLSTDSIRKILIEMIGSFVAWYLIFNGIYSYTGEYFELSNANYPLGLIGFLCAIAGCIMIFSLSRLMENIPILSDAFSWLGENSMVIFGVHYMDALWMTYIDNTHQRIYMAIRVAIDVMISAVYVFIRNSVNRIYHKRIIENKVLDSENSNQLDNG